jgi:hypothetical protein
MIEGNERRIKKTAEVRGGGGCLFAGAAPGVERTGLEGMGLAGRGQSDQKMLPVDERLVKSSSQKRPAGRRGDPCGPCFTAHLGRERLGGELSETRMAEPLLLLETINSPTSARAEYDIL